MHRDRKPANAGGSYYVKSGEEVPFDDSRFKPLLSHLPAQGRPGRYPYRG